MKKAPLYFAGALLLQSCNPFAPSIPDIPSIPSVPSVPIIEEEIEKPVYEEPVIPGEPIPEQPVPGEPIPEPEPEEPIPVRDDFYVNMSFSDPKVGYPFIYDLRVQNKGLEHISINNESGGLEFNLTKGDKKLKHNALPESLFLTLKEQGYIEIEQSEDKMKITTENTIIEYDGITYELSFKASYSFDNGTHTFANAGTHALEILMDYVLSEESYAAKYEAEFEVAQ